ncbi:hypothetical protein [Methanolobus sp.]|jgi:uncharacterized membrane protein|uniref:hypothetical protein n=1 Tax=Methanolobus sp. TaxID=1874737 RepID=UPI0025D9B8CC|nr:hypothetical protein [Methanolobus sp.]
MSALFDYSTSPLNPGLKILTTLLFFVVAIIYYDARTKYGGAVRNFISLLLVFALLFAMSSLFRYFGHGTDFGFTNDYSLKWLQSLFLMLSSLFYVLAGRKLLGLFGGK